MIIKTEVRYKIGRRKKGSTEVRVLGAGYPGYAHLISATSSAKALNESYIQDGSEFEAFAVKVTETVELIEE